MSRHHAPRGRIKARGDHMDGSDHMDAPRCTATAKGSGQRCKRRPIPGGTVCIKHGGGAPQVKAAAARRLDELEEPAVGYYAWLLEQREYPSAGLGAANAVMDRLKGKPHESVDLHHSGEIDIVRVLRDRQARRENLSKNAPASQAGDHAGDR